LPFDGIDDFISGEKLTTKLQADLSLSFFVKTGSKKEAVIADLSNEGVSGLKIGMNAEGKIYLNGLEAGSGTILTDTLAINDDNWHFIGIRRQGSVYQLYIDSSTPVAFRSGTVTAYDRLTVGATSNGSSNFEGSIDEVKLFDSAIEEGSFSRNFAPLKPLKLTYTATGLKIRLTWVDKTTDEDGFVIERKTGNGNWEEYYHLPANAILFMEELKTYSTEYSYRVRSYNEISKSAASNEVSFTTPKDPNTAVDVVSDGLPLTVYPNPVQNHFTIISDGFSRMRLSNAHGQIILEKELSQKNEIIDMSSLPKGFYFMQAYSNEKSSVVKLVKN